MSMRLHAPAGRRDLTSLVCGLGQSQASGLYKFAMLFVFAESCDSAQAVSVQLGLSVSGKSGQVVRWSFFQMTRAAAQLPATIRARKRQADVVGGYVAACTSRFLAKRAAEW